MANNAEKNMFSEKQLNTFFNYKNTGIGGWEGCIASITRQVSQENDLRLSDIACGEKCSIWGEVYDYSHCLLIFF